eukprot:443286_1
MKDNDINILVNNRKRARELSSGNDDTDNDDCTHIEPKTKKRKLALNKTVAPLNYWASEWIEDVGLNSKKSKYHAYIVDAVQGLDEMGSYFCRFAVTTGTDNYDFFKRQKSWYKCAGYYLLSMYIQQSTKSELRDKNKKYFDGRIIELTPHWKLCWNGEFEKNGQRINGMVGKDDSWKWTYVVDGKGAETLKSRTIDKHCYKLGKICNIWYCLFCLTPWRTKTKMEKCKICSSISSN